MKRINFLNKLRKEGKLEIIDPSEDIKESYLLKSASNLISSKILLDNKRFEEAIGLAYYSMYHFIDCLII